MLSPLAMPLFVCDGLDVVGYLSLSEAARDLEVQDVVDGAYVAFDSEGRRLSLIPVGNSVVIQAAEARPSGAGDLVRILQSFFRATGEQGALESDLSRLVEIFRKRHMSVGR